MAAAAGLKQVHEHTEANLGALVAQEQLTVQALISSRCLFQVGHLSCFHRVMLWSVLTTSLRTAVTSFGTMTITGHYTDDPHKA